MTNPVLQTQRVAVAAGANKNAGKVDLSSYAKLTDLLDYEKLAIPTTQDNLYTNLIANSLLIPNQWYLITDFVGEYLIPNTTVYRSGLVSTYTDADGVTIQLTYDDGVTPIVDGDPEQIYVLAVSPNSLYPVGRSKTFSDEQVTFQQNVPTINGSSSINGNGQITCDYSFSGSGNDDGGYNNYGSLTVASVIDDYNLVLGGDTNSFINRLQNGNLYLNFNNDNAGQYILFQEYNLGSTWSFNPSTNVLTNLAEDFSFTNLIYSYCYWDGYYQYQPTQTGTPNISNNGDITIDEIISSSQIVLGGNTQNIVNRLKDDSFYIAFSNDLLSQYVTFNDANENVDWSFNPTTKILTNITGGYDFTTLVGSYSYFEGYTYFIEKTFQGQIIERYNAKIELTVQCDYRSQLFRRYKVTATDWEAGTTHINELRRYNGSIYHCTRETTTTPTNGSAYWIKATNDRYYYPANIYSGGTYYNIDSASYIDTPSFNTNELLLITGAINLKLLKRQGNYPYNIVDFYGLQNTFNNIIYSIDTTIYGQVFNSDVSISTSIIGDVYNAKIFNADGIIIENISSSVVASVICSVISRLNYSNIFYLDSAKMYSVSNSVIYYSYETTATYVLSVDAKVLNTSYFAGYCYNSLIMNVTNCQFLDDTSYSFFANTVMSSIQDSIFGNYFRSNNVYAEMRFNNTKNMISGNQFYGSMTMCNATGTMDYSAPMNLYMINSKINSTLTVRGDQAYLLGFDKVTLIGYLDNSVVTASTMLLAVELNTASTGNTFNGTNISYSIIRGGINNCILNGGSITSTMITGVLTNVTMGPSSLISQSVFNGYLSSSILGTGSKIVSCNFNGNVGGLNIANSVQLDTCKFADIQSVSFTYNVQRCTFFKLLSGQTTPALITDSMYFGDFVDGWVMSAGRMFQIGSGRETKNYKAITTTANISLADYLVDCTTGTFTVTLLSAVTAKAGAIYHIKNSGTGVITLATTSGQTIDGSATQTINSLQVIKVMSNGVNWIII